VSDYEDTKEQGRILMEQPNEDLCAQRCCRQVPILVLPSTIEEGQEGQRRDCRFERRTWNS
jgi:hypothetical protein